jgi:hypothetical protein
MVALVVVHREHQANKRQLTQLPRPVAAVAVETVQVAMVAVGLSLLSTPLEL